MMWYRILPQVLNMSLTGSMVILFVLLARLALKKAPKIFSYALWGIVLFRLLCPVALTSDFSLLRIAKFADTRISTHTSSVEYISSDLVESIVNPQWMVPDPNGSLANDGLVDDGSANIPGNPLTVPTAAPIGNILSDPSANQSSTQLSTPQADSDSTSNSEPILLDTNLYPLSTPISMATILWLTGILVLLGYSVRSLQKLRRQLVGAVPLRDNIYLADHITTPFVLGVLRPRIYLPSSLSEDQQAYILLHEQHHVHRLDHIAKLLAFAALCVHWFNPLVWLAYILSIKDMEMSCDEAVLRQMGDSIRVDYSASLLSLATGQRVFAGAPLAFGEGDTKDRIHNVLNWKKPGTWITIFALLLCGVLALSLLTNPSQRHTFTSARYRVEQILYDAPQYSFTYSTDTAPQYTITSDYVLMMRSSTNETATWQTIGALREVNYTRTELYSLFDPLYCNAHEQLDQVTTIYRAEPFNVSAGTFFLVMQTYDGDVLLAHGYGRELTGHVLWLFELEKQSGSYDLYELNRMLVERHGEGTEYFALYEYDPAFASSKRFFKKGTEYFALYERDTEPGSLLLGFQQGDEVGYAVFRYDVAQDSYVLQHSELLPYSLTGLYTVELSQDDGYGTNLQVILSSREDMAAIRVSSPLQATSDFQLEKEVPVAGKTTMLVFECPDAMTLKNLHIEYFYDWSDDWTNMDQITIPTGTYYLTENSDEETAAFAPVLSLQADHTFYFTYDPLSSYLSYGHYTIEDDILTAVTDDGRYQYCFEIVGENALKFLQDSSSDVSLTDSRLGVEITDGALFHYIGYHFKFSVSTDEPTSDSPNDTTGESSDDKPIIYPGAYLQSVTDPGQEWGAELVLQEYNGYNNRFSLFYDPLAPDSVYGSYVIQDDTLLAISDGGEFMWWFQIMEDHSLRFLQEGSSPFPLTNEETGAKISDQDLFQPDYNTQKVIDSYN